ncbi:MAG: type II toxin-antitoxin system RelB/DinJ family antitoxin [Alphaproteobacteria bacterium]|nr:type II toxin-antitoxin system RelB/DinJ family antitoxin [Alphaproteobacteria bacterium]
MTKSSMINTRVEPALKKSSEAILARLGLSTSEAVNIFLSQLVLHKGFPFPVQLPNEETRTAIKQARQRKDLDEHSDFGVYLAKRSKSAKSKKTQ